MDFSLYYGDVGEPWGLSALCEYLVAIGHWCMQTVSRPCVKYIPFGELSQSLVEITLDWI